MFLLLAFSTSGRFEKSCENDPSASADDGRTTSILMLTKDRPADRHLSESSRRDHGGQTVGIGAHWTADTALRSTSVQSPTLAPAPSARVYLFVFHKQEEEEKRAHLVT